MDKIHGAGGETGVAKEPVSGAVATPEKQPKKQAQPGAGAQLWPASRPTASYEAKIHALGSAKPETRHLKFEIGDLKLESGNWKLENRKWKIEARYSRLEIRKSEFENR
jgi:hypothetical protein